MSTVDSRTHTHGQPGNDESHFEHASALTLGALARDPALIAGIYEACDQWCMYCPATRRCLAFRSVDARAREGVWDPCDTNGERPHEATMFVKALADAEGRAAPPEIEAIHSGDRQQLRRVCSLDDPLERLGRSYMELAAAYLQSRTDFPPEIVWRRAGPLPLELLTWYHVLAPARVFRAILCAEEGREGVAGRQIDALRAAKVAHIGIDRSLAALTTIATEDDDPRLELLRGRLQRLAEGLAVRFPDARGFIRAGLDDAVASIETSGAEAPAGRGIFRLRRLLRMVARGLRRLRGVLALLHWRHERLGPASRDVRGPAQGPGPSRG